MVWWRLFDDAARHSLAGAGFAVQDYLECLHHRKEITRMNTILQEAKRQDDAAAGVRLSAAAAFLTPEQRHVTQRPSARPRPPRKARVRRGDESAGKTRHAPRRISECAAPLLPTCPCPPSSSCPPSPLPLRRRGHQHQQRIEVSHRSIVRQNVASRPSRPFAGAIAFVGALTQCA